MMPPNTHTTTARGHAAEKLAAAYLAAQGYRVLDRNWRNRWCELDIVAQIGHGPTAEVHFIEVKYRRTTTYGYATEYISRDKTTRLIRAAAAWAQTKNYTGPYQISVVAVEGSLQSPTITFVPGAIFT